MFDATEKGYAVIRSFEGRALRAYRDEVGVWTIGYGITNYDEWAVSYLGRPIGAGLTITEEQAEYLLQQTIKRKYAPQVGRAMPNAKPNELDAGISFHYNTGAIARASWVRFWREHRSAEMASALMAWNKAGGRVLAGLTRRRRREYMMIVAGDYGPEGVIKGPVADISPQNPNHHLAYTPGMPRVGDTNDDIRDLNTQLRALGFDVFPNSLYDAKTQTAVLKFQTEHPQLQRDGIAGPATRAAIRRELDARRKLTTAGSTFLGLPASLALGLPMWACIIVACISIGAVTYYGWRYQDEIKRMLNDRS